MRTAKRNHPLSSWLAHAPTHARDVTWPLTITLKPWTFLDAHIRVILSLYLGMANFDLGEALSEAYGSEVASPMSDAPLRIAPYPQGRSLVHPLRTIYVDLANYSPLIK